MKHTKRSFLQLLSSGLFAAVLFTACDKDDVKPNPGNPIEVGTVSRIEYDDNSMLVDYNDNGTIASITAKTPDGDVISAYDFVYDGGKIDRVEADGAAFEYTYTGDKITRVDLKLENGTLLQRYDYAYDGNKLKEQRISGQEGEEIVPEMKIVADYDANGNIIKSTFFELVDDVWEETGKVEVSQYDNKVNIYSEFETFPYLPGVRLSVNNAGKELHYDETGTLEETITHTYTYDANGRPITRKTVSASASGEETINTKYFY